MPQAVKDLIYETSTSSGTGNFTLAAVNGKVRFSDSSHGYGTGGSDVFVYYISHQSQPEYEWGTAHMSDADTLVRDTVLGSSNANAAVNFSAGTKDVTSDVLASKQVQTDLTQTLSAKTFVAPALGTPASGTLTNCTGLPIAGLVASTSTAIGVGSIELGHATDTTLSRASAGQLAVEGVNVLMSGGALGTPSSGTLTNCTGLPASALVASTSQAVGFGSIELGHASDTTVSRSAAGIIAVEGVPLYSQIPQNSQSAAYTLVLADAQKHIFHPASDNNARTFTIPANSSVAYPVGTCLTFVNEINTVTIAITSDTLTMAGTGSTGSRSLAANGIATALKVASTKWVISGTGLT